MPISEKERLTIATPEEQRTKWFDIAFIWFCANVAVPRLMIGGQLIEMGFWSMLAMITIGNCIIFIPLLALGDIGYKVKIPTMAATRFTFGIKGSYLPSIANGVQLLGWAANVTVICGSSIDAIISNMTGYSNLMLWIIITAIAQLIITAYGFRSITWLQRVSVPLLLLLSIVTVVIVFKEYGFNVISSYTPVAPIGIMIGVDILAANAFAWGPMVCDYTRYAKSGAEAGVGTLVGSLVGAASFMFVGGISFIATGSANPVDFLLTQGLGIPALLIIILSSVTTNVVNLYSSGISFVNVFSKVEPWKIIVPLGVVVGLIAIIPNLIGHFITFLIIVGAIFVPLIGIMLVDFCIIKKKSVDVRQVLVEDSSSKYWFNNGFNWSALCVWFAGIIIYNLFSHVCPAVGACVPTLIVVCVIYYIVGKSKNKEV